MGATPSTRGPIPKRESERAGHRAKDDAPDKVTVDGQVTAPPMDRKWAPAAKRWYQSLTLSGQAKYFEPSDWEEARLVGDLLSGQLKTGASYVTLLKVARALLPKLLRFAGTQDEATALEIIEDARAVASLIGRLSAPPNAAMMKELFKAMADLGTTEGSRRRLRIEVQRDAPEDPEEHTLPALTLVTGAG